jgi:hypothetical protein
MRERFETALILRLPAPCHVATQGLPASARYVAPRRRGVAALRALRFAQARASGHRLPTLAVCKPRTAAGQLPRARSAWLPFGPARVTSAVPPRARSASGACLRAPACECGAPRVSRRGPPRFARTAPRPASANAFALLPPPRETTRSFLPSPRAWRRAESAAVLPLPPPCRAHVARRSHLSPAISHTTTSRAHAARRAPPAWNGPRCSRRATSKGARRRALATPQPRGELAARCACPLSRIYGRNRAVSLRAVVMVR